MKEQLPYKGFVGSVQFSAVHNVFFGKIEGISEWVTFKGQTLEDLEDGVQWMVDLHLADSRE